MEREFILLKPDAVQRNLVGTLIERLERSGLKLVGMKMLLVSKAMAEKHYAVHKERPFYKGLVQYISSGPTIAIVMEGSNAVAITRKLVGSTNPKDAAPGTIRGDYALDIGRNLIHASDSVDNASYEMGIYFQPSELVTWNPVRQPWVVE